MLLDPDENLSLRHDTIQGSGHVNEPLSPTPGPLHLNPLRFRAENDVIFLR